LLDAAAAAAKAADVAIVFVGLNKQFDTEGSDRRDMKLPYGQDDLIARVVAANPRTIVVLVAGSPVEMGSWLEKTPAVLLSWYGGSEAGNAIARTLFGVVNPSGKLPCTFPKQLADSPAHALGAYPGANGVEEYKEGLLVGYRWFDTKNIEPLFPFGHGLSYTTFNYSNLRVVPGGANGATATAQFDVTNTGTRDGAEVAQLYLHQASPSLPRPDKELKGFQKVALRAGETQTVSIPLGPRAFAFYSPDTKGWVAEAGDYQVIVGSSSRDLRLKGNFSLGQTLNLPVSAGF
jgi:beta-glucosidase